MRQFLLKEISEFAKLERNQDKKSLLAYKKRPSRLSTYEKNIVRFRVKIYRNTALISVFLLFSGQKSLETESEKQDIFTFDFRL